MADLHVIRTHTLRDIPAVLRALADDIEQSEDGTGGCVIVWEQGSELHVSYCGDGEAVPNAHFLLHCGAAKMMHRVSHYLEGE